MTKLEQYYQFIDTLEQNGNLSDEQIEIYKKIEEELILDEVCLRVGELVKDELSKLRRSVTFVIDYDPVGRMSVKATHNRCSQIEFTGSVDDIVQEKEQEKVVEEAKNNDVPDMGITLEDSTDEIEEQQPEGSGITRGPRKSFRVFLNGKEIIAKDGAGLLAETIRRIGFKKVAALNIMYVDGEYNLVDKRQRIHKGVVWQRQMGDWYIYTNSTTPEKVKRLREIARRLQLDLIVDDGNSQTSSVVKDVVETQANNYILITTNNINDSEKRKLRITFNGKIFEGRNAKSVFIDTLKEIGLEKIPEVGITCSGYNLVSTTKRTDGSRTWQEFHDGYWVYIYFSNPYKVKYLLTIAEFFNLDIKIEAIA